MWVQYFQNDSVNVQIISDNDLVGENTDNFELQVYSSNLLFFNCCISSVKDRKKQV